MKVNFMIAATMLCVIESVAQEVVPDSTVTRDCRRLWLTLSRRILPL